MALYEHNEHLDTDISIVCCRDENPGVGGKSIHSDGTVTPLIASSSVVEGIILFPSTTMSKRFVACIEVW